MLNAQQPVSALGFALVALAMAPQELQSKPAYRAALACKQLVQPQAAAFYLKVVRLSSAPVLALFCPCYFPVLPLFCLCCTPVLPLFCACSAPVLRLFCPSQQGPTKRQLST